MLRRVLIVVFLLPALFALAQDPIDLKAGTIIYKQEFTVGFTGHTAGYSLGVRRSFHKTDLLKRVLEFDFTKLKHPKEIKVYHPFEGGRGYYFGKTNAFMSARLSYGQEKKLIGKTDRGSVRISYLYYGGLSTGILKPVYLEILYPTERAGLYIRETERYDPINHNPNNIAGRASFGEGINEISLMFGGHAKGGFSFEFAKEQTNVIALELGMAIDYFPTKVPIMATANKQMFTTYYISLQYGMKWN